MPAVVNRKIEVENLRTFYGAKEVHHGISFHIEPNEIFAIIGPAQSGKTTLLRAINRTLEFTAGARLSGSIKVDGCLLYTSPSPRDH
jgi:phosphate transport system ATP-binding protein